VRKLFIWPFLLICVATVTFFGVFTGAPLIILLVVYSIGVGTAMPLFRALILENDRIGYRFAGSALGLTGTINGMGRMLIPFTMGAIMDVTGEYWPAFLLLAVLYAVGATLATQVKETGLRAKREALPSQ
jgi:MFS family permease